MQPTKAPLHLSHKPIVSIDNYAQYDGANANNTDAIALSLGFANYDSNSGEIAAKIWRHTGDRFSRQGEELPLHRVLDLATLIVSEMCKAKGIEPKLEYEITTNDIEARKVLMDFLNGEVGEHLNPRVEMLRDVIDSYFRN